MARSRFLIDPKLRCKTHRVKPGALFGCAASLALIKPLPSASKALRTSRRHQKKTDFKFHQKLIHGQRSLAHVLIQHI